MTPTEIFMKANFTYNDGGASKSLINKNDNANCAVRAIAIATGQDYDLIATYLMAYGREAGRGTSYDTSDATLESLSKILKFKLTKTVLPLGVGVTVAGFLPALKSGTYLVGIKRHIFCVKDGKINDTFFQNSVVLRIFKIEMLNPLETKCGSLIDTVITSITKPLYFDL